MGLDKSRHPAALYPASLERGPAQRGRKYESPGRKWHPSQKPARVMQDCVRLITPGLVIIDPFMGSGTTLVAALREGYACIGIEVDAHYFQIACTRVEDELQQLALFA